MLISHTNLVGTRAGMLIGGYAYTQYAYKESRLYGESVLVQWAFGPVSRGPVHPYNSDWTGTAKTTV
jgi:hypothetical protein